MNNGPDLFAEAREAITISDAWTMLGLEGEPRKSCRSPFREDRSPSFSIFHDGRAFKDQATGEGGDVIEFIRIALGGDHRDVREWLKDRTTTPQPLPLPRTKPVQKAAKKIEWPAGIKDSHSPPWKTLLSCRGITNPAAYAMVQTGVLRFVELNEVACYIVTDATWRAAEIRRVDGGLFGSTKAFPLRGVDKRWLPGIELLRGVPKSTSVLITEGATDLLSGIDLYSRYRRAGGKQSWIVATILGAACRILHPEAIPLLRGRHIRIVPDADPAGDGMADHWSGLLRGIGCPVDVVTLPRDSDLTDNLHKIKPSDLFTR